MRHSMLEAFDAKTNTHSSPDAAEIDAENQRLSAFEEGYQAGWDDATKAQADQTLVASNEFTKNLKDLSFSFHEANHKAYKSAIKLLLAIFDKIAPAVSSTALTDTLYTHLHTLFQDKSLTGVTIECSSQRAEFVKSILPDDLAMPIEVRAVSSENGDQVRLKIEDRELENEALRIAPEIANVLQSLLFELEKEAPRDAARS